MKRKLKSALDLVTNTVNAKQQHQKYRHDQHAIQRDFDIGDNVFALIHSRNNQTWLPATVTAIIGPISYVVLLDDMRTQRCHVDQLRKRESIAPTPISNEPDPVVVPQNTATATVVGEPAIQTPPPQQPVQVPTPTIGTPPVLRRIARTMAGLPPNGLNIYIQKQ